MVKHGIVRSLCTLASSCATFLHLSTVHQKNGPPNHHGGDGDVDGGDGGGGGGDGDGGGPRW